MDRPTLTWLHENVHASEVRGRQILEVGSMDVNGSIRPHVLANGPAHYLGVDIAPGPGVDEVVNVNDLTQVFGEHRFDVVISTEMLEHVEDWRNAIAQLKAVLHTAGTLILTTRRPGFPRHCHPNDHWRFTPEALRAAFRDFYDVRVEAITGHGVALRARKPAGWTPKDLRGIHAHPAPKHDLPPALQWAWVKLAYRGQNPSAREVAA